MKILIKLPLFTTDLDHLTANIVMQNGKLATPFMYQ